MIENQIEFNKVKEIWAGFAITKEAKDRIKDKWIILDESTLRAELKNTSDAKEMIEKLGNPPLQDVSEILEILEIASKGECLTPYRLERVQSILSCLERLSSYLNRGKQYNNSLAYYDETLFTYEELKEKIVRQIRPEQVDSYASKDLFDIRMKIEQLENEMIQKAESVIRTNGDYMTFDKDTLKPTYKMVIGEAGESCAFYIADRLGMPSDMLNTAVKAAYGKEALNLYSFNNNKLSKSKSLGKVKRTKKTHKKYEISDMYKTGDSVIVFPEKKIGIVCEEINERGVLRVQIAGKKIWINHRRVKLYVKAEELYPEDYDMSIVFDSVENRKVRHDMGRKYTTETIEY